MTLRLFLKWLFSGILIPFGKSRPIRKIHHIDFSKFPAFGKISLDTSAFQSAISEVQSRLEMVIYQARLRRRKSSADSLLNAAYEVSEL